MPPESTFTALRYSLLTDASHALIFGSQKLNLHLSGREFEPKASRVQPGSEDLCFITEHPIDEVLSSWTSAGIEVGFQRVFGSHLP